MLCGWAVGYNFVTPDPELFLNRPDPYRWLFAGIIIAVSLIGGIVIWCLGKVIEQQQYIIEMQLKMESERHFSNEDA